MTKRLFICEKKATALIIANYLAKVTGATLKSLGTYFTVGDDTVAYLSGHVVGLVEPEAYNPLYKDRNNFSVLPIVPEKFKLDVSKDEREAKLFRTVQQLLNRHSHVVHFGDAGQEGQLIVDEVLEITAYGGTVDRLWTQALDDVNLARAFEQMRPNSEYRGLSDASVARRNCDWIFGINASRAVTIAARRRGAALHFTIGRVQTPTLALVVENDQQIRNFSPVDHFIPYIDIGTNPAFQAKWSPAEDDPRLDAEKRLIDRTVATRLATSRSSTPMAEVIKFTRSVETSSPPLPFSTSELYLHISKLFGLEPAETEKLAEILYLKKLITYPRTASRHLPESQHSDAGQVLSALTRSGLPEWFTPGLRGAKVALKSKAWNDSEVAKDDHHAIIPCAEIDPTAYESLTPAEKQLYNEIAQRYVLQFWPEATYDAVQIDLRCDDEPYRAKSRTLANEGWRGAFKKTGKASKPVDEDDKLPTLRDGQKVPVVGRGVKEEQTKPPERFTAATLQMAMKDIYKYVKDPNVRARLKEKAGIGTDATRTDVIQSLIERKFIEREGRFLVPTRTGIRLWEVLPRSLTVPDMTAMWESFMDAIKAGTATYQAFMDKQVEYTARLVQASVNFFADTEFDESEMAAEITLTDHECDVCNSRIKHIKKPGRTHFRCSSEGCNRVFRDVDGLPIAPKADSTPPVDSNHTCPTCMKHKLAKLRRRDGSGEFWLCRGGMGSNKDCTALFPDKAGSPDLANGRASRPPTSASSDIRCPTCKVGHLVKLKRKPPAEGFFWGCDKYRDGCKHFAPDKDGKPGDAPSTPKAANGTPPVAEKPTNRFMAGMEKRGAFAGRYQDNTGYVDESK